jgi:hypothetical protein
MDWNPGNTDRSIACWKEWQGGIQAKIPEHREILVFSLMRMQRLRQALQFCGSTRIMPPRGLLMSAMRKNAIEIRNGKNVIIGPDSRRAP